MSILSAQPPQGFHSQHPPRWGSYHLSHLDLSAANMVSSFIPIIKVTGPGQCSSVRVPVTYHQWFSTQTKYIWLLSLVHTAPSYLPESPHTALLQSNLIAHSFRNKCQALAHSVPSVFDAFSLISPVRILWFSALDTHWNQLRHFKTGACLSSHLFNLCNISEVRVPGFHKSSSRALGLAQRETYWRSLQDHIQELPPHKAPPEPPVLPTSPHTWASLLVLCFPKNRI